LLRFKIITLYVFRILLICDIPFNRTSVHPKITIKINKFQKLLIQ
jgi:hypothetical protein